MEIVTALDKVRQPKVLPKQMPTPVGSPEELEPIATPTLRQTQMGQQAPVIIKPKVFKSVGSQ